MDFRNSISPIALIIAASLAGPVCAQQAISEGASVEEVIVTATRRAQRLIEAPVAVTAIGGVQLEASGVSDIRELTSLAPSVQFQTPGGSSDSSIRIRGIGTTSTNPGLESSVGVLIDGVIRPRTGVALSELGDLESIEVLRGPQGTLFGRNTSSGLINVTTRRPSLTDTSGRAEVTAGNYSGRRIAGSFTTPLVEDKVGVRFEGSYESRDGFFDDINSTLDQDNLDRYFLRGKLLWQVSDSARWLFSADYTKRNENCCIAQIYIKGATYNTVNTLAASRGAIGYSPLGTFDRVAAKTPGRFNEEIVQDWGVSAQGDYDLGFAKFTTISAFRTWDAYRAQDFDHSGVDLGFFEKNGFRQGFDILTQELRLQGAAGRLDWLVGAFYADETVLLDNAYRMGADYANIYGGAATFQPATLAAFKAGDGARGIFNQDGTDLSVFTHNIFQVTDKLSVTAGLRFTKNEKSVDFRGQNFNAACDVARTNGDAAGVTRFCASFWDTRLNPAGDSDSRTEEAVTGTFNVAYRFAENFNSYVSYSRGYKSGGYNLDRGGFATPATPNARDLSFVEETVDSYEVGLKAEFLERRLRANFAAFHQKFEGFQLVEYTGVNFVVGSLAEAVTRGAELEITFAPTDYLTFSNGLSYTEAFYPVNPGNRAYSGKEMEQSPDWVNVTSVNVTFPITENLKGVAYADARYSSEFFTGGFDVNRIQKPLTTVNARFSLRNAEETWSLDVWARNLTNAEYFRRIIPATFQAGSYSAFLGDPRTYGVTLRREF